MIEKILVAFDGSEHAERALDFALDLAQKYSAKTTLLTVVPPLFLPLHSMAIATTELMLEANRQLENVFMGTLFRAEEKARNEKPQLKIATKFAHGRPEEVIIETAKEGNFNLIVMGSRGLGRRADALGSVSSSVADCATCPVMIVK